MSTYIKDTINFHNRKGDSEFSVSFFNNFDINNAGIVISAACTYYNPIGITTVIRSTDVIQNTAPKHLFKESVIKMFEDITYEYKALLPTLPIGLYEYNGIRIVKSDKTFHKVIEEDVVDMDSLDPLIMQTVKYATALVHAFIILQTDSKLPKWLNEELEGHRALNMLEG